MKHLDKSEIAQLFGADDIISCGSIDRGHINTTSLLTCADGMRYVLQSLSGDVFRSPEAVMRNIAKISKACANSEGGIRIPQYLNTKSGENFVLCDGTAYRMYTYTEPQACKEGFERAMGFSFGAYINMLGGKNTVLEETIPDFHCITGYFNTLKALAKNKILKNIDKSVINRLSSVVDTVTGVFTVDFPKRNVHNDAKRDNIIFGEVCTVIDLDTTMKGYAAIDYGDMIRSVIIGENIGFKAVKSLTEGFVRGLNGMLTHDEVYSLYYGILYVTAELAIRYLIDYMSEERYFKGKTAGECLTRADSLLKLLNLFIAEGGELTSIIYKAFKK